MGSSMPVTAQRPPGRPLEATRRRVERHLRTGDGPAVHVALLGVVDALAAEPPATRPAPWPDPDGGGFVPVQLHDSTAIIGPVTAVAGDRLARPCLNCLARRWQVIRSRDERDALEHGVPMQAVNEAPFMLEFPLETVRRLVQHVARTRPSDPAGHPYVFEVRLDTLRVRRFPLLADADCPLCGDRLTDTAAEATRTLGALRPRPKRTPDTFRLTPPGGYGLQVGAYVNPVCGALGVQARTRLECTTTAPAIGHIAVRGDGYVHDSFWGGHAYDYDTSVVLGILEGLERHAGMRPRRAATAVVGSYEEVRDHAVDPRVCGVYADEYYDRTPYYTRYTPQLKLRWVWGYSLRDRRPVLVPESLVYYHVSEPLNKFVQECSNGCAVGSCLEEAVFYGLLELIERDAFLTAWYGRAGLTEIDPASIPTASTRMMVDRVSLCGYDVRLFDTRVEFPVPVVTAVGVRRDRGPGTLCVGAGTSLHPEQAVRAALGEIANTIPGFDVHSKREAAELREMAGDFRHVVMLKDHPRLFGLPDMARHADFLLGQPAGAQPLDAVYRDWERSRPRNLDLLDDLRYCLDLVVAAGFDVVVVDQTSPEQVDAGVRSACVVVPGLLPIDFGWERQRALRMPRLRSAFRRAGWRSTDLDPAELHLVPHPFP